MTLGFGNVYKFKSGSTVFHRYIVSDFTGVLLLCVLFNGNLCLNHRISQLHLWITAINTKLNTSSSKIYGVYDLIIVTTIPVIPTLKDAWLSGFTDAEGCFNINITQRNKTYTGFRIMLRFLLDQKNAIEILSHIRNLFGFGAVILRKDTKEVYRYYCDSFIGLKNIILYFQAFPLKTIKASAFNHWLKAYKMVENKEHLTKQGLTIIRDIKKQINVTNEKASKIGSAKP